MRLSVFLLIGYSAAVVAGVAATLLSGETPVSILVSGMLAVGAVTALVWITTLHIRRGIQQLEQAVATGQSQSGSPLLIRDFQVGAEKLRDHARRWKNAATHGQQQSRNIDELLQLLSCRNPESPEPTRSSRGRAESSAQSLRGLLSRLSRQADSNLKQFLTFAREIDEATRAIAAGAEDQSDVISRTTTYVEQLAANIDTVSKNSDLAHNATLTARDSANEALELVRGLIHGMESIRNNVQANERKLRALGERSNEIGSIVETIGTISSRTDLLALNASIESVRAGEHGRGFAVVADEVRNLAEQTAQATREVAGLIKSVQFETQESISVMAAEHLQLESEVRRIQAAGAVLEQISKTSTDSASKVGEITQAAQQQLRLTQDVILAMENISEVAKASRSRADGVCWTTKSLTKTAQQLEISLIPLRGCLNPRGGGEDSRSDQFLSEDDNEQGDPHRDSSISSGESWEDTERMSSIEEEIIANVAATGDPIAH